MHTISVFFRIVKQDTQKKGRLYKKPPLDRIQAHVVPIRETVGLAVCKTAIDAFFALSFLFRANITILP